MKIILCGNFIFNDYHGLSNYQNIRLYLKILFVNIIFKLCGENIISFCKKILTIKKFNVLKNEIGLYDNKLQQHLKN